MKKTICLSLCAGLILTAGFSLFAGSDGKGSTTGEADKKIKCPRKVEVMTEVVTPVIFRKYQYFTAPALPEVVAVNSPVAGVVAEIRVLESSLLEADQELALVAFAKTEEIKKLEVAVEKKKKVLKDRQNRKVKSAQSIQAAEKDLAEATALLEAKAGLIIKASGPGMVSSLKVKVGDEIAAGALLLEIIDPRYLSVTVPLAASEGALFHAGEKLLGKCIGLVEETAAEVVAVDDAKLVLRLDNADHQIKEGNIFTFRRLQTEHADALTVPAHAVGKDGQGNYVYVVAKNKARKTYVVPGAMEALRTQILQGLAAEQEVILSGFDCLVDGKKIILPAPAAVAAAEEPVGAEELGGSFVNRMKVGVHGTYYLMTGENFQNTYSDLSGFGGELSIRFSRKLDFWLSGGLAMKKAAVSWSSDELSFQMIPLAGAFRYYYMDGRKFNAYVGAGPNVFLVTDKSPAGDIKNTLIGFHALTGGYYKLSRKFSLQLMAKYNMVKKDVVPESTFDDPLDLGGLELNFGIAFSL
jgi:HlyD family secretion protein